MAACQSSFVSELRAQLTRRLVALEEERQAIDRALTALAGGASRPAKRDRSALDQRVLDSIGSAGGARTTLIALDVGVAVEQLEPMLARLQTQGVIERDRLGWRRV